MIHLDHLMLSRLLATPPLPLRVRDLYVAAVQTPIHSHKVIQPDLSNQPETRLKLRQRIILTIPLLDREYSSKSICKSPHRKH